MPDRRPPAAPDVGGLPYAVDMSRRSDTGSVAHVVVDVPTRHIANHFDYSVPPGMDVGVGSCVLVALGGRKAVGYVMGLATQSEHERLRPIEAVLSEPFFGLEGAGTARWIATEYASALSEAVRLFAPPGGAPRAMRTDEGWVLERASAGPVDDRWAELTPEGRDFRTAPNATLQRALLDALSSGPVRVPELAADLGGVDSALRRLVQLGAVRVERRRRLREAHGREMSAPRHERLTAGQSRALDAIRRARGGGGGVVLLEGVTGSGKTEVYLRAIEEAVAGGGSACVLVPEISLTPQTVGRFRSRFGDDVAVLHSRLSAGERYDQWDLVRRGAARIVVGARSALFAPFTDLRLIVIDEEHETSYKQGQSPRYHARDVAVRLAAAHGAVVVLGSASPSMESLSRCESGEWERVELPERVTGRALPVVRVVDMKAEFGEGHRSMFSRPLAEALRGAADAGEKAVLFLNRRGFASFMLCRECGFVPRCASCATSMTYHDVGKRLACHHCGAVRAIPAECPECRSPYLRLFGTGTQRVEAELANLLPGFPVVRMDADTTRGKGSHERLLASFETLGSGALLGTQMIAKGLDYPDVTLVGVISADVTLHLPDFRASERTYQLLEQVAGRAGRGERGGQVIVQTYWPEHPAILAAASHDPADFRRAEAAARRELGYPPFGRLANVLVRGRRTDTVRQGAHAVADSIAARVPDGWTVLGPSPAPLERLKGVWRWHVLVKGPAGAAMGPLVGEALSACVLPDGVTAAPDVDPSDLL